MRCEQSLWTKSSGWSGGNAMPADLVLVFGGTGAIADPVNWDALRKRLPHALLLGCSTGAKTPLTGFYSYGEVSPHFATHCAEMHNQTMTVTLFSENGGA